MIGTARSATRMWSALLVTAVLFTSGQAAATEAPPTPTAAAELEQVEQRLDRIGALRADARRLEAAASRAEGDSARILHTRLERKSLEMVELAHGAARTMIALDEQGTAAAELRQRVVRELARLPDDIHGAIGRAAEAWRATDTGGEGRSPAQESETLEARRRIVGRLDALYQALLDHVGLAEQLGLDASGERARLVDALASVAETSSVFLELARERAASLAARLKVMPTDEELEARVAIAHSRVRGAAEHLRTLVGLMNELGLDTTAYQQEVIAATGDLDAAVLDVNLIERLTADVYHRAKGWLDANGSRTVFKAVLILLILLVSWAFGRLAGRLVRRALESDRVEISQLLKRVVVSSVRRLILLLGFLIALAQFGISIGPLLAGLGVAGFIVGFALQDTLSNFASGMFILLYRPYDVGDAVEAGGVLGSVSSMSLVNTTILTFDNQRIVVPNNKIWGGVIKNITAEDIRRVDMTFGISYSDDIPRAEAVLGEIVAGHDKVLDEPAPVVRLHELGDSSVNFIVRPWTRTADYWDVYWDVTREVKLRFDREGISIPFPQHDVHLFSEVAGAAPTLPPARLEGEHVALRSAMPGEDDAP